MDMEKEFLSADHFFDMTVSGCHCAMVFSTDENGILYIPEWPSDTNDYESHKYYRCRMNWQDEKETMKGLYAFDVLNSVLFDLAPRREELTDPKTCLQLLSPFQFYVWNTYLREFDTAGFDLEAIDAISEKMADGRPVSSEEQKLFDDYVKELNRQSVRRIGPGIAAYDVIIRARRVYTLRALSAPFEVINREINLLTQAFLIHRYARSMELVDRPE